MEELNNILKFNDFKENWEPEKQKPTKRTDTGLDILKEGIYDKWSVMLPITNPDRIPEMLVDIMKKLDEIDRNMVRPGHAHLFGPG